jgi:hypothetical protein
MGLPAGYLFSEGRKEGAGRTRTGRLDFKEEGGTERSRVANIL